MRFGEVPIAFASALCVRPYAGLLNRRPFKDHVPIAWQNAVLFTVIIVPRKSLVLPQEKSA
jgi:hypothetical protein